MSSEPRRAQHGRALEAAHWLFETQRIQLAQDPNRPRSSISSTRDAARRFDVSKSNVARQLAALKAGKTSAGTGNKVGRPSRLTDVEDKMLSFHTFMLRREMRPVSMKVVKDAADALLSRRRPPGAPVSGSWVRRWLRADRAQAREGAMSGGVGELQSADLVEADIDEEGEEEGEGEEEDDADADDNKGATSEMEAVVSRQPGPPDPGAEVGDAGPVIPPPTTIPANVTANVTANVAAAAAAAAAITTATVAVTQDIASKAAETLAEIQPT